MFIATDSRRRFSRLIASTHTYTHTSTVRWSNYSRSLCCCVHVLCVCVCFFLLFFVLLSTSCSDRVELPEFFLIVITQSLYLLFAIVARCMCDFWSRWRVFLCMPHVQCRHYVGFLRYDRWKKLIMFVSMCMVCEMCAIACSWGWCSMYDVTATQSSFVCFLGLDSNGGFATTSAVRQCQADAAGPPIERL